MSYKYFKLPKNQIKTNWTRLIGLVVSSYIDHRRREGVKMDQIFALYKLDAMIPTLGISLPANILTNKQSDAVKLY